MMNGFLYLLSLYLALSANQFFSFWMALELNLILFLGLMASTQMTQLSLNMKYFLIQSLGSGMFLFSVVFLKFQYSNFILLVLTSSLMLKLGAAPFHTWFISLSEGLTWEIFFLLSTVQKIAPLYLFFQLNQSVVVKLISVTVVVSIFLAWGETGFKKLMAISSVFMLGWLISTNYSLSMIYLWVYALSFYLLVMFFFRVRLQTLNMNTIQASLSSVSTILSLLLLNFAGAPPFSLFFCKILIISQIIWIQPISALFLVFGSAVFIWIYTRFMINILSMSSSGSMWTLSQDLKNYSLSALLMMGFIPLWLYMY